jgi:nickel transport protein
VVQFAVILRQAALLVSPDFKKFGEIPMNLSGKREADIRLRPCPWLAIRLGLVLWLSAAGAEAHSVYIFAFQDDGQICTNSYFGGKNKVRGGLVSMAAASGEILATAQTDDQGDACFPPPEAGQDLIFSVEAGDGHRAEFKLPASETQGAGPAGPTAAPEASAPDSSVPDSLPAPFGGLSRDDLRQALAPIMRKLAEMESAQESRINLRDIIGGLGWIIGLAGAALWAANRKNTGPRGKS